MHKFFITLLIVISIFGLTLRLVDYDRLPPFGETKDEFIYPWAGMSLLQTGVPTSWSPFSYPRIIYSIIWDESFPLVTPYIEKPFLYPLLTGSVMLLSGINEFNEVRLSFLRLIPIALSGITILFLGLFVKNISNKPTALLATLLYASTPIVVLSNRLSLTENLLTPIVVCALWLLTRKQKISSLTLHIIGLLCGLAIATKQTGLALPISVGAYFVSQKSWRPLMIISIYTIVSSLIHPLIAVFFDWSAFVRVTQELRSAHALGLPEAIATLFRFPGLGHKERIFLDGIMLLGTILLISAPLWLKQKTEKSGLILVFPITYLVFLFVGEGGQTWYGWHIFPLYPFTILLFTLMIVDLWEHPSIATFLVLLGAVGSSTLRFLILIKLLSLNWQPVMIVLLIISLLLWMFGKTIQRRVIVGFVALVIVVNVMTILNARTFYPSRQQPLSINQESIIR